MWASVSSIAIPSVPVTITIPSGTRVVGGKYQSNKANGMDKITTSAPYDLRVLHQNFFQNDWFMTILNRPGVFRRLF